MGLCLRPQTIDDTILQARPWTLGRPIAQTSWSPGPERRRPAWGRCPRAGGRRGLPLPLQRGRGEERSGEMHSAPGCPGFPRMGSAASPRARLRTRRQGGVSHRRQRSRHAVIG